MQPGGASILAAADLDRLLDALRAQGYQPVGPQVRDGAIVYDELPSAAALPVGVGDEQAGGHYRLTQRGDAALFGYAVGPHSWKKYLHPPLATIFKARRSEQGFELLADSAETPRYAFVGVRACELAAIARQDRVLLGGPYQDSLYAGRRERAFFVALNCAQAGGTCFCASMQTGPRATCGFDLALTELLAGEHRFLLEAGSGRGAALAAELPTRPAAAADQAAAAEALATAAGQMGRTLDTAGLERMLQERSESSRWEELGRRCLSCANCTLVCPTCFCTSVEDLSDLAGLESERRRRWESCFTVAFSYIHGGSVRSSAAARYRQWLTHKLGTWHAQFGSSGCVGCGRCITWCPVGIDITEEAAALRGVEAGGS